MKLHKFRITGFYSKMLLFCILILSTISLILAAIVSSFAKKYEQAEFLKKYDLTLNNLHNSFELKQRNYNAALDSLFDIPYAYNDLCTFLQIANPYDLEVSTNKNIITALNRICDFDSSCIGILLFSNVTKQLYQFDPKYSSLNQIPLTTDWPEHSPFTLGIMNDTQLMLSSTGFKKPSSNTYGLVGTIFKSSSKTNKVLGQIILLYPTSEFLSVLNSYPLSAEYAYSITDSKQNIIFRSSGDYSDSSDLFLEYPTGNSNNVVSYPTVTTTIGKEAYFTSSIYNGRYDFYTSYQIKKAGYGTGYTQNLILLLALFTCVCSISLYVVTFQLARKKVRIIQKGMSKIGSNNLTYRIPHSKGQDEYSHIITGFNRMCDDLQKNVEQSYVYALQQKNAELYALQTSINPHFLYNTLELIRVQTLHGNPVSASQMILLLAKIYRNQTNREMFISLGEELEQCENLISLYQYRFQNFEYEFYIEDALSPYGLPKNTLQPLIENYFVHGLDKNREDNYLKLDGALITNDGNSYIKLTLSNNGQPITEDELKGLLVKLNQSVFENNESSGFALSNVNNRLRIVFGEDYGIQPGALEDGSGFSITIMIPPVLTAELRERKHTVMQQPKP
ncbi:hypothetical protein acsn021_08260 [Anaerocolumna cellulosilytica]|uniref:Uncharacterized protein n=1 Tax=Anaerocolumna cellulosilytica TaxID=433286 RepID=A0A6S6QZH9_9FIRM|nr:histidine kinase [Anaerocolumna cellulosilytica]MBB5194314.1 sensor histidine kinase YesM [Anaerocolumna cellulosilytica]BCJ93257.1 hypothetical protein acsn021_08260 [Anaerocolumna cellulosilytica]